MGSFYITMLDINCWVTANNTTYIPGMILCKSVMWFQVDHVIFVPNVIYIYYAISKVV